MKTINAINFLDQQGLIVESASLLAAAVIESLEHGGEVEVCLSGLKGISSSYFNIILKTLTEKFGADVIETRVRFRLDSEAQRQVLKRSLDSIRKSVA